MGVEAGDPDLDRLFAVPPGFLKTIRKKAGSGRAQARRGVRPERYLRAEADDAGVSTAPSRSSRASGATSTSSAAAPPDPTMAKVRAVRDAGFPAPVSVRRPPLHTSVEYKTELPVDKIRLFRDAKVDVHAYEEESMLASLQEVARMVEQAKALTAQVHQMDRQYEEHNAKTYKRGMLLLPRTPRPRERARERERAMEEGVAAVGDAQVLRIASENSPEPSPSPVPEPAPVPHLTPPPRGASFAGPRRHTASRSVSTSAPRPPFRSGPSLERRVVPKAVETMGSGFKKARSLHPPRWIDHGRLLAQAQMMADLAYVDIKRKIDEDREAMAHARRVGGVGQGHSQGGQGSAGGGQAHVS